MKFYVDYQNGMYEEYEADNIYEAMDIVDSDISYTQCNVYISESETGETYRRRWWGVPYDPATEEAEEDDIISFGDFGYYGAWEYIQD